MNETPGARMRVSYAALSMAEFFRDALGIVSAFGIISRNQTT